MTDLEKYVSRIMQFGPDGVVINVHGEATSSRRASRDHEVEPDVIFIRDDGWSLGAPHHLEDVAYKTWSDKWLGFMRRPARTARPIKDYQIK